MALNLFQRPGQRFLQQKRNIFVKNLVETLAITINTILIEQFPIVFEEKFQRRTSPIFNWSPALSSAFGAKETKANKVFYDLIEFYDATVERWTLQFSEVETQMQITLASDFKSLYGFPYFFFFSILIGKETSDTSKKTLAATKHYLFGLKNTQSRFQ